MQQKHYHIYISTNKRNTVLYTGITSKLLERAQQHIEKQDKKSFTAKYNINKVVYYEEYHDVNAAIAREKEIKGWIRKKKASLVESVNPEWRDLLI